MKRTSISHRTTASVSEALGYVLFIEDRDEADVLGIFWTPVGQVDQLVRGLECHGRRVQLIDFANGTWSDYQRILASLSAERAYGYWHHRSIAVDDLISALNPSEDAEAQIPATYTKQHRQYGYEEARAC